MAMTTVLSANEPGYRQCALTVMDNIADPDIKFDEQGISNYYMDYKKAEDEHVFKGDEGEAKLASLAIKIKEAGQGKPYDCLIGLSGGVDSTYVAYLVKRLGLRPLAVHLDNGWNSELAVMNIENVIGKLGIDLFTFVINWEEFRDVQLSYLKASVVDIEVVSDHAIFATMYKLAKEKDIHYIINGSNIVTEHIMPPSWIYQKMDFANLKDIHSQYGKIKLKTYPYMDFGRYVYYSAVLKLKPLYILNYVAYDKKLIKEFITKELNWRDYGGKHYESAFTKFYQAYILPEKFKIDKRKPHLSTLIASGQLGKDEALNELSMPLYRPDELERDKEYVLKKLGLSAATFSEIMAMAPQPHEKFKSDLQVKAKYIAFLNRTKRFRQKFKFN